MALCTGASTLLRGFRSYGAVLAGYTVVLIAMPAVENPDSIFTLTMARVSVVFLGIACSALVGALLTGRTAERDLDKLFRGLLADLFAYCRVALRPGQSAELRPLRRALATRLGGLEDAIRFAAAESRRASPRVWTGAARCGQRHLRRADLRPVADRPARCGVTPIRCRTIWRDAEAAIDAAHAALARHDDAAVAGGRRARLFARASWRRSSWRAGEGFLVRGRRLAPIDGLADMVADFIGERALPARPAASGDAERAGRVATPPISTGAGPVKNARAPV